MGKQILTDSKGYALVIALIMLLVLTIIGISAITTTTYETNISGNERIGTDAFYAAEAGIQVALARIRKDYEEGSPINLNPIPKTKLGENSYFWSGSPEKKEEPFRNLGSYIEPGFEAPDSGTQIGGTPKNFNRYQLNFTGQSFGSTKEIEVQIIVGVHGN